MRSRISLRRQTFVGLSASAKMSTSRAELRTAERDKLQNINLVMIYWMVMDTDTDSQETACILDPAMHYLVITQECNSKKILPPLPEIKSGNQGRK